MKEISTSDFKQIGLQDIKDILLIFIEVLKDILDDFKVGPVEAFTAILTAIYNVATTYLGNADILNIVKSVFGL